VITCLFHHTAAATFCAAFR